MLSLDELNVMGEKNCQTGREQNHLSFAVCFPLPSVLDSDQMNLSLSHHSLFSQVIVVLFIPLLVLCLPSLLGYSF